MDLQGRVVLVLGAGSGIGRACAVAAAEAGATVVVGDKKEEAAQGAAAAIIDAGGSATTVTVDVRDEASVEQAVRATVERHGAIHGLVNSVGASPQGPDRWHAFLDVYLKGPFYACKYALEEMERGGGGAIVNIGSIASVVGGIGSTPDDMGYATAKHGILGLTRTIALAYAKKNIRVNLLCPGYIRTEGTSILHSGSDDDGDALINETLKVPMGRWGEPSEIGKVAAFLLSDDASFITGQPIMVDGGFTIR
jgi:NAD(P)-dependent dehydrogenase (short-subunit alcohol dehydrogenase family)